MYYLTQSIITKAANSTFLNSISGRFFNGHALENTDYPYCTFLLPISDDPRFLSSFTETIEDIVMQFSIFSAQKSPSEALTIYGYLKSLYDDCSFSITGSTLIWMVRQNSTLISEEHTSKLTKTGTIRVWHYAVDYNIVTQES